MAVPTENVTRVRGEYATRIVAHWLLDQGPHITDGFCPLQNCPKIERAVTDMLATRLRFNMQVVLVWETSKDGEVQHPTPVHHMARTLSVDPNTLAGGNLANYTWERLLQALNEEFSAFADNEKLKASNVKLEHLTEAHVQLSEGKALHLASIRGKPLVLRGGAYVPLPTEISNKKATLTIQNRDEQCFRLCVLAFFMGRERHDERPSRYMVDEQKRPGRARPKDFKVKYIDGGLDWSAIPDDRMPSEENIAVFEETNDVGIYVYRYFDENRSTHTKSGAKRLMDSDSENEGNTLRFFQLFRQPLKMRPKEREIVLLLYSGHFSLVTDLDKLINQKRGVSNTIRRGNVCHRCGERFDPRYPKKGTLEEHLERQDCSRTLVNKRTVKPALPKRENAVMQFKGVAHQAVNPLTVYADFECLTKAKSALRGRSEVRAHNDEAVSIVYAAVGRDGYEPPKEHMLGSYMGPDPAGWFLRKLLDLAADYRKVTNAPEPLRMTEAQRQEHKDRDYCHICGLYIENKKVADHNHFTGEYRGPAHDYCNKQYRVPNKITVFFHNLSGFDGHLLIKAIVRMRHNPELLRQFGEDDDDYKNFGSDEESEHSESEGEDGANFTYVKKLRFDVLAKTNEKYAVIRFGPLVFKDSMRFLKGSLDSYVKAVVEATEGDLDLLAQRFPLLVARHPNGANLEHLFAKLKMPFKAMVDRSMLKGPAVLDRDAYYNEFKQEEVSEEELEKQRSIVATLGLRDFGELMMFYNICDTLQLADIMETFRTNVYDRTGLEPVSYVGCPKLSWDALLKASRQRLQLIHEDNGGYEFLEEIDQNIRGGLSVIFTAYAEANQPLCDEARDRGLRFDPSKPTAYLVPFDANSLYPHAMTFSMPIGQYREVAATLETAWHFLHNYKDTDDEGGMIFCDISVPAELHDILDLAPVAKRVVDPNELTEKQREVFKAYNCKLGDRKLMPYLGRQQKVAHHVALLQFYVGLGVKIHNVTKIRYWRQKPWMRDYMQGLYEHRCSIPKSDPMNEVDKLLLNTPYGMTLQNKTKYCNTTIFTDYTAFVNKADKPTMESFHMFELDEDEGFLGIVNNLKGHGIVLDTPRLVGFCVLEISKREMFKMYYHGIKVVWSKPGQVVLLMMDTDSFYLRIQTDDLMADIARINAGEFDRVCGEWFRIDTSKVNPDCPYKGRLGLLKVESGGLLAFAGVRAKCYATLEHHKGKQVEEKKFKGVPKVVREKQTSFDRYRDIVHDYHTGLVDGKPREVKYSTLRSKEHSLEHMVEYKKDLAPANDKVYEIAEFRSRPLGHHLNQ